MDDQVQNGVATEPTVGAENPAGYEVTPQVEQPVNNPVPEGDENIPEDLPEDPSKQREAFIKMRQKLSEFEKAQKTVVDETPDPEMQATRDVVNGMRVAPSPLVFGQPDLNDPIAAARAEAQQARHEAQTTAAMLEDMQAEAEYPELRGKSEADKLFQTQVQRAMVAEMYNAQVAGRSRKTLSQVTAQVKKEMSALTATYQQMSDEKAQQNLHNLEQAALEPRGQSANIEQPANNEERSRQINRGNDNALIDDLLEGELAKFSERDLGFF